MCVISLPINEETEQNRGDTKVDRIRKKEDPGAAGHKMDVVVAMTSVAHKKGALNMITRTYTG